MAEEAKAKTASLEVVYSMVQKRPVFSSHNQGRELEQLKRPKEQGEMCKYSHIYRNGSQLCHKGVLVICRFKKEFLS